MNLCLVNVGYPPFIGGSQNYAHTLAQAAKAAGEGASVVTTTAAVTDDLWSPSGRQLPEGTRDEDGISVPRCALRHLPLAPYSYYVLRRMAVELSRCRQVPSSLLWRLASFTPWVPKLGETLAALPQDVSLVHAMSIPFESLMYTAWSFARRRGIPYVATPLVHLGETSNDRVRRFYTMSHQLELLRRSHAVIALTPSEHDFLIGQGVSEQRLFTIPLGVAVEKITGGDAQRFRSKYGISSPFIFYLGTVAYEKGAVHLVEAMRLLWEKGIEAPLVLAGAPMLHFQGYYRRLSSVVKARCRFLGTITEEDKKDLLAAGLVLALPSRTESFGLAYLEAWANGKPVIGACAGGTPDVIADGVDGFLVPFGDVGGLAQRLKQLLQDHGLAAELGAAGRVKVEREFTVSRMVSETRAVYERVLRDGWQNRGGQTWTD